MKNKKTPAIRFAGFQGDWEKCFIKDLLKVNSGRDYKHLSLGNIPVYGTGGYMLSVNDKLSEHDAIGIGRKGTINKPQMLKAPFWTVDTLFYMTAKKKQNLLFLYSLSNKLNWLKYDESTGVPSLSKSVIEKILIHVPALKEQIKIGEFFKTLDDTIALHEQELERLKQTKQGFLQKMFPAEGEAVPALRFPEFAGDWEEKKLGDIKDVRDGTHDSPKYHMIGFPLITSKNLSEAGLDFSDVSFISKNNFMSINKRSKVDIGDIIFGMIGTIGNPVIVEQDNFAIKNVALIKNSGGIKNMFLVQHLKSDIFKKYIFRENAGNTQKFLGLNKIRYYKLLIPSLEEQTKIGNFFKALDDLIALKQRELDGVKETKKAFLQKMFI